VEKSGVSSSNAGARARVTLHAFALLSTAGGVNAGTHFENLRAVCEAAEEFGYI